MLNRYTLFAFLFGLLIASAAVYFLLPTKIEIKEVVKTVEVEKIVNRDVIKHQVKTIYKDGTIKIVTDSHDKSKDVETVKEVVKESTQKVTGINTKRLLIMGGVNPLHRDQWLAGMSYNVLGPVDVGCLYQNGIFITAGVRF